MKYIIGNIKMNQTIKETKEYLIEFLSKVKGATSKIVLCLPFTSLSTASELVADSGIIIGAQNINENDKGAYTGEINAQMLKGAGVSLVLIGHSERRAQFKENNETINLKIKRALSSGLKVVLCFGETKSQRAANKTFEVVKTQIEEGLSGLYENELGSVILAYEPVWAIGTGKTATAKQAEEVAEKTRSIIKQMFSEKAADKIHILYGGSVNPKNAKEFLHAKGINGLLVGGACLNPDGFAEIVKTK